MSQKQSRFQLDERQKQVIRETIAGYAAANEYLERERLERLANLTPEEAHKIYTNLIQTWDFLRKDRGENELYQEWRLLPKLQVRTVFKKFAISKGLL
ncbi:MAG: hypothetical protein KJ063_09310 [Anaerolineae bacterium]|nr:hypothetical protein [Anaerolineae bacterium]